jgi:predicted permease
VSILHGARAALLVFLVTYLASLAVPQVTSNDGLQEAASLLALFSFIGIGVASMLAVTTQLALIVRRTFGKRRVRG